MVLPILIVSLVLRLPGLLADPPGFSHAEASVALAAQRIERGSFPIYFADAETALEPGFVYAVNLTGQIASWGVTGPRLAAALLGAVAAIACALWYRQALGRGWGLTGGLLVATSFWQLAFSRQAVPAIAMAAVGAIGLVALQRAIDGRRGRATRVPTGWYGLAGVAFGLGIYTDVAMRAVIPAALLMGVFLLLRRNGPLPPAVDRRGLALGLVVMLLVAAPLLSYYWQNSDMFWFGIDQLRGGTGPLDGIIVTLDALVWSGNGDPAQTVSGRAVLDPILVVWALLGLGFALRRPQASANGSALIWLATFLVTIVAVAPGDHGQMLALTPALFFFPILGMQGVVRAAASRGRRAGLVAITVVALSITASAAWSLYDYVWNWTDNPDTYRALAGDVRDAVETVDQLPPDNLMVYFSTGEQGRIVRYLAPDRPRRDFGNPDTLPLPADGAAYVIAPVSAMLDSALATYLGDESLVETGAIHAGEPAYRLWFVDGRTRDRLPYAAPVVDFEGGPDLIGFEVTPLPGSSEQPAINVVLVYRVAPGAEAFRPVARLVRLEGVPASEGSLTVHPAPDLLPVDTEIILARIPLPFPDAAEMIADLQTAMQTLDGEYLPPGGPNVIVVDDHFAVLNAIGYIGPEP